MNLYQTHVCVSLEVICIYMQVHVICIYTENSGQKHNELLIIVF